MSTRPFVDLDLHLPADARAARTARHTLDGCRLSAEVRDRFHLAVSEVVTNAVQHGTADPADQVELVVRVSPAMVRVEVVDQGRGFEYSPSSPGESGTSGESGRDLESGWGLYLVNRSADRWGIECDDATTVWFEIDLSDSPGPPA
jgi:anti-sigma regulatory factor (Ser/Thr protein kinase)